MNQVALQTQSQTKASLLPGSGILQRKCACGNHTIAGGECAECAKKKQALQRKAGNQGAPGSSLSLPGIPVMQRKLTIGASNDPLEKEADRVADQVLAAPAHSKVSGALPLIQRYAGQATGEMDTAPASVERVLAGSGRPLDPALRQDMGQRFGYDFSRVRVHSGAAAEQSARDVNAQAYTVGHNVVFGAGQFAPGTHEGRRLIAHELTHVAQQSRADSAWSAHDGATASLSTGLTIVPSDGFAPRFVQRSLADDLRAEADRPSNRQTPGRLGELESQSGVAADQQFQQATGEVPTPVGTLGRGTAIINHIKTEADRLEGARANGYQDAVFDMLSMDLSAADASAFWIAFAGNTIWALSSLVPLAGPALAGGRLAATAVGRILIPILERGAGAYATTAVGLAGAQLAQWSTGGPPSASSMPHTRMQIRDQFYAANASTIARLKTEAHALTLEALTQLAGQRQTVIGQSLSASALENMVKELVMQSLFSSLYAANGIDQSNYTIRTNIATRLAENDLLQAYVLTHGAIRDQSFTSTDEFEDRKGAEGTASALSSMGGISEFSSRLRGKYDLVVGNINGTLADWGALDTLSQADQHTWSTTNALASGDFSVPFRIVDPTAFTSQLNGNNYSPDSRATSAIRDLRRRGGRWMSNVIPQVGRARFSSSDYSSMVIGGRTVRSLDSLRLEFVPSGSFSVHLDERSTIEPGSAGTGVFSFTSGNTEAVDVDINPDIAF